MSHKDSEIELPNISPFKESKLILQNFGAKRMSQRKVKLFESSSSPYQDKSYSLQRYISAKVQSLTFVCYSYSLTDASPLKYTVEKFNTPSPIKTPIKALGLENTGEVFSINTIHSKNERFTLKEVCRQTGWKETKSPCDGSLVWHINALKEIDMKILSYRKCFFNRYPKSHVICRKRQFHLLMRKYQRFFPDDYNFLPTTFILPEEHRTF